MWQLHRSAPFSSHRHEDCLNCLQIPFAVVEQRDFYFRIYRYIYWLCVCVCEGGGETAEFRKEVALDGQGPHGACGGGWSRSITARTLADDLIFLISEVSKHADSFLHVTKCADLFCISQRGCVCFPPFPLSLSNTHSFAEWFWPVCVIHCLSFTASYFLRDFIVLCIFLFSLSVVDFPTVVAGWVHALTAPVQRCFFTQDCVDVC